MIPSEIALNALLPYLRRRLSAAVADQAQAAAIGEALIDQLSAERDRLAEQVRDLTAERDRLLGELGREPEASVNGTRRVGATRRED